MYSITDAYKALSCGRSTVYAIMKEAGIETKKSGLSQLMTDEQFEKLREIYYEKYPNQKSKQKFKVQSNTYQFDLETKKSEIVQSEEHFKTYQNILEEERKVFALVQERDAEYIKDLRQERDHYKELMKILLEKNSELQNRLLEVQSNLPASASNPRTPVKFPDYDPNVDTLTQSMFDESSSEQSSESPQKPGEAIFLKNLTGISQFQKPPSEQLEAFSEDGPPLTPDEAMIRFFKGRFPQRTPDMNALLQYLEDSGFPHTRDAASTRLAKLRRKQRAAKDSGEI